MHWTRAAGAVVAECVVEQSRNAHESLCEEEDAAERGGQSGKRKRGESGAAPARPLAHWDLLGGLEGEDDEDDSGGESG